MARTNIPVQDLGFNGAAEITELAGDATNDHIMINDGKTILHVNNNGGGTVIATVKSVKSEFGRTGDLTLTVPAGKTGIAGPFRKSLFDQSGADAGKVHIDLDVDTSVVIGALSLTG